MSVNASDRRREILTDMLSRRGQSTVGATSLPAGDYERVVMPAFQGDPDGSNDGRWDDRQRVLSDASYRRLGGIGSALALLQIQRNNDRETLEALEEQAKARQGGGGGGGGRRGGGGSTSSPSQSAYQPRNIYDDILAMFDDYPEYQGPPRAPRVTLTPSTSTTRPGSYQTRGRNTYTPRQSTTVRYN